MQAIHFSSMRIEIEKSVSSQPASQPVSVLLFYVIRFYVIRLVKIINFVKPNPIIHSFISTENILE